MRKRQNKKLVRDTVAQKKQSANAVVSMDIETTDSDIINTTLVQQYQEDIAVLELALQKSDVNYHGMIEREKQYLKNIASLKAELESYSNGGISRQDLEKVQNNYEGLLLREERYLREIRQLKDQVLEQKNALYRTYSYRLGYLLIHSTKSFKNFISLPSELIRLYRDNKQRKNMKLQISDRAIHKATKSNRKETAIDGRYTALEETYLASGQDKVKIATIMDEFTSLCFAPEADTLQITPENYLQELNEFQPDFVFIESAWQGKDGLWKLKISQQADELLGLINYCRANKIKTLFWNKEDPVHFGTFIEVAKLVDVVFTTDIDCIQKYKKIVQHDAVYLMPFAAQPKVHNPIEFYERIDKFNFAGSYYLKYPVRQRDFAVLSDVAINSKGLDIYDRNFNNDHPHYQFPERYQSLILGSLAPEEIDKAYKGYEFGINMNTIKQSQTMFARRVFEMLASNTIVLSNYSRGVRLLFGDLVICSDNANELQRQIDNVLEDTITSKKFKLQGLRSVLSQHTYEHRLKYILQKLKINHSTNQAESHVVVLAKCETQAHIDRVIAQFNRQAVSDKSLFIETSLSTEIFDNVSYFKNIEALNDALSDFQFSHITLFDPNDYYGREYLTDMLHSYSYLKHYNDIPVTKGHYYSYQGELLEQNGEEYKFVTSYDSTKTMYTQARFSQLLGKYQLGQLLDGITVKDDAFSIDCFNYIQNGYDADSESIELICQNLELDSGVSLVNHLLPISEAITFEHYAESMEQSVLVDATLIKETLRKEIKLTVKKNRMLIDSTLPADQHRLLSLTAPVRIDQWNRIKLKSSIESKGDVLFVFEFFDQFEKQLSHITAIPNQTLTLEVPEDAVFGKLSLRIKGKAQVAISSDIQFLLDNIAKDLEPQTYDSNDIRTFTKDDIDKQLVRPKSKQILISNQRESLEIKSTLAEDKHAYVYFRDIYTREEVNLALNSVFETTGEISGFDFRTVFLFLDENKEKLAHTIIKVDNCSHAMAIPEACRYIRIGFKITGTGSANLHTLKIGEIRERVNNLIGKSDTLVLAKQYPSYDDLYKYGFLHSRLRAYKQAGKLVDMFKIAGNNGVFGFSEFESVDLFTGDAENLKNTLKSGQFKRVFVHILDKNMWSILEEFVDTIEIVVWVHGSEAQVWQRRAYEFEGMPESEVVRRKKLSDQRKAFWQQLINKRYPNIKFIFVSEYFKNEFVTDICNGEGSFNYEIIHNYIDGNLFPYHEKSAEDAYKVLSIRPFSSLTYANDLTVKAILELSKEPDFNKFQFTIVGDGALFDTTVEPLKQFENVTLRKEFLTQPEIAKLHQAHGIFLVPTRMDTQGVSRGEATSSGLVAVTTDIAAVSEFLSNGVDGMSVPSEDYIDLSEKLKELARNNFLFKSISSSGASRVRKQCSFDETIVKEISLQERI